MANQVTKTIIVKADAPSVYEMWADFENFPHFMEHIKSVRKLGPNASEWTMKGPLGATVKWRAQLTREEENKRLAWNTKDNSGTITTSGQVTFNSLPENQTEITVILQYSTPGGGVGEKVAELLGKPEERLVEDLRNFKSFAEGMYDRTPKS